MNPVGVNPTRKILECYMNDNWCSSITTPEGVPLSGGAARNHRIRLRGGMDNICKDIAEFAARMALQQANFAVGACSDPKVTPIKQQRAV